MSARTATSLARSIAERLRAQPVLGTPTLHRLRRGFSKELAGEDADVVLGTALRLHRSPGAPGARMIACAIVGNHPTALERLDAAGLERFGSDLTSWGDVDMFGCLLAGRAWRDGSIADDTIHGWARSKDRWFRRLALVCTVPLNVKAQGGRGDSKRTLKVCELLVDDRDDMVVKALSWALRELATRDPNAVAMFVADQEAALAARVKREVRSKLETGVKHARSRRAVPRRAQKRS